MGWASCGDLIDLVIDTVKKTVPKKKKKELYKKLIQTFEDCDWDTQYESLGRDPVFDEVMAEIHPDYKCRECKMIGFHKMDCSEQ